MPVLVGCTVTSLVVLMSSVDAAVNGKGKKSNAQSPAPTEAPEFKPLPVSNDTKQSFKIVPGGDDSVNRTQTEAVPTRSGCSCSDSYGVGGGDCADGDTIYSGCQAIPCDGDSTTDDNGTVWPSWCHTIETECAGNGGQNWDYCDPATGAP